MIRLWIILLALAAAVYGAMELGQLIAVGSGYILVSYSDWTLETTFWTGALAFLLLLGSAFVLMFVVLIGMSLLVAHGPRKGHKRISKALENFAEGNFDVAKTQFLKDAKRGNNASVGYLMAARSSAFMGDGRGVNDSLSLANESKGSKLAVALTTAQLSFQQGQYEDCLAELMRLDRRDAWRPLALQLKKDVYIQLADWKALARLLPDLRRRKALKEADLKALECQVYCELLKAAEAGSGDRLTALQKVWAQVPSKWTRQPQVAEVYAQQLIYCGADVEAEAIMRPVLSRDASEELLRLYGLVAGADLPRQLSSAEALLKDRPNSAALLLSLGRLCLLNRLWEKARDYLEQALAVQPSRDAYAELGRLAEQLGDAEQSVEYYRRGCLCETQVLRTVPEPKLA